MLLAPFTMHQQTVTFLRNWFNKCQNNKKNNVDFLKERQTVVRSGPEPNCF